MILVAVPVVAALAGVATLAAPAASQETETLAPTSEGVGGFDVRSQSAALLMNVDTPTLPLPRLAQVGVPYAATNAVSGPSGLAVGSVLWPGPIVADPASALAQLGPALPIAVPSYPIRAQAALPSDQPTQVVQPAPGVRMTAEAGNEALRAGATYPSFEIPGLITVGSLAASSDTTLKDGLIRTTTHAQLAGVELLGGLIKVGALTSDATAVSNGKEGRASGSVSPMRFTVGGQNATLGPDGFVIPGQEAATAALNQFLAQLGMEMHLLADDERADEPGTATADVSGLIVRFAPSAAGGGAGGNVQRQLSTLLATLFGSLSLPPEVGNAVNAVNSLLAADYHISFILGSSSASVVASPGFGGFETGNDTTSGAGFDTSAGGFDTSVGPTPISIDGGGAAPSTHVGDGVAVAPIDATSPTGTAVPLGAVVAAILAAPAFAGLARRFGMFALTPAAAVCPLEKPPKEPR